MMGWGCLASPAFLRNITELDLLMPNKTHPGSDASALFRGLLESSRREITERRMQAFAVVVAFNESTAMVA